MLLAQRSPRPAHGQAGAVVAGGVGGWCIAVTIHVPGGAGSRIVLRSHASRLVPSTRLECRTNMRTGPERCPYHKLPAEPGEDLFLLTALVAVVPERRYQAGAGLPQVT